MAISPIGAGAPVIPPGSALNNNGASPPPTSSEESQQSLPAADAPQAATESTQTANQSVQEAANTSPTDVVISPEGALGTERGQIVNVRV